MATLTMPTEEEARHFMRAVDSDQAFVATVMSPSAGSSAARLLSLGMVQQFLEDRTMEDFQAAGLRLNIHYADFGFLAQWFEEVVGDAELAGAISELHATGEAFGMLVPRVKELLQERLDQCVEVLEPSGDGGVSVETTADV
ncbi:hypothetical protein [Anaerosoma tenue]|uniref:hypothetical protein n=1 Tax=Anaerosoma tenue TaxID=2933588 RepID=UPI002260E500|nr:hypothetical protein [Anaerosoma tenue]MCK8115749.1 hypothetical protein [Anaerosoma tenue]